MGRQILAILLILSLGSLSYSEGKSSVVISSYLRAKICENPTSEFSDLVVPGLWSTATMSPFEPVCGVVGKSKRSKILLKPGKDRFGADVMRGETHLKYDALAEVLEIDGLKPVAKVQVIRYASSDPAVKPEYLVRIQMDWVGNRGDAVSTSFSIHSMCGQPDRHLVGPAIVGKADYHPLLYLFNRAFYYTEDGTEFRNICEKE